MRFFSYISKARTKSPKRQTKTTKKLDSLSKNMGTAVRLDFLNGIQTFKKKIPKSLLAEAWEKGDYHKIMAIIPWDALPGNLNAMMQHLGQVVGVAGNFQLEKLPPNINEKLRMDTSNLSITRYIDRKTGSLINGIQADAMRTVQDAITNSFTKAMSPRQVANEIKGSIGLLPAHENALENYREGLVQSGMPEAKVEKLAGDYEERLLDYRAMMIARTETQQAIQQGQMSVWQEGVRQGYITGGEKEWVVDGDPCDICVDMDGIKVGLDEPWIVEYPDGQVKNVFVPSETHPHCMCNMELHFAEQEE